MGVKTFLDGLIGCRLIKDEVNLQQSSLTFRCIRKEDDRPDYITKLLPRNSDLRGR